MEYSEKSGQIFIAYQGNDISADNIVSALSERCPRNFTVMRKKGDGLVFAKIVYGAYVEDRDPFWNAYRGVLTVSGFNQNEIEKAVINSEYRDDLSDRDKSHQIINLLFCNYGNQVFKNLSNYMHFCSVIWDRNTDSLIAGVTEPNSNYNHLYYGHTKENKDFIFSNNKDILYLFCSEVMEMENNTYMQNGIIYNLDGTKFEKKDKTEFIKKSSENADSLINGLNALLLQITNDSVKSQIEKNVNEYLISDDSKKRIEDFIFRELSEEIQKQLVMLLEQQMEEQSLESKIEEKLKTSFDEKLEEYTSSIQIPVVHVIKLNETVLGQTKGNFYHEKFNQILTQVQLDEPIMLIGPAGSGKNVAISQVADALGQHMYYTNNASNEFKLTGFIDAGGNYRDTEFYKAFKNGGIFFLDEIDNSDPSALIVINSALANGYMAFPHETIDRHPDFRIIAAANTWGRGADLQYVGRNALDGATLDRFDNIFFDYDENLEQALYPNDVVLKFMWAFRNAVYKSKIPHIVSTRGIGKVYKKEINGLSVQDILTSNVIKNLTQDDVNSIIGNMDGVSLDNKYFDTIRSLRLSR